MSELCDVWSAVKTDMRTSYTLHILKSLSLAHYSSLVHWLNFIVLEKPLPNRALSLFLLENFHPAPATHANDAKKLMRFADSSFLPSA